MSIDLTREFEACRYDVDRFARVFLGIKLHPGQRRMAQAYLRRTDSRWRAFYLWIMVAAGNRAGKTLALSIIILHSVVYRMGMKPPDPGNPRAVRHWGTIPYHWWHFAVEQGPAEQVFHEIATILCGIHAAQKDGCPWADQLGGADKIASMSDMGNIVVDGMKWGPKERGEYAWIKLVPALGGGEIHFRSTKAKALSAVGQNMHGLSFDEAGLESNLRFLLEDIMHARRIGTGGQFILIGTASAATSNEFEDLWYTGDPDDPFAMAGRYSMTMSSRENVGYGLDRESFEALIAGMDHNWIAQNIDGQFIQSATAWFNKDSINAAFSDGLPEEEDPRPAQVYLHALDPGLKDRTWSMVFRLDGYGDIRGVKADRQIGKQTTRGIVELGRRNHMAYLQDGAASIETGVDTTALGGHMFRDLLEEHFSITSVEFGGLLQGKRKLLSDLRTALDEGRIHMPASGVWGEVRRQLIMYKLMDRKIEQDAVMCLAIIVKLLRAAPAQYAATPTKLDFYDTSEDQPEYAPGEIGPHNIRELMRRRTLARQQ